jgi:hypothetical protein
MNRFPLPLLASICKDLQFRCFLPGICSVKAKKGHEYLDHDSYMDYAQFYEEDFGKIKRMLIGDLKIYLGRMGKNDFRKAKNLILSANSIPIKLKKKYGLL